MHSDRPKLTRCATLSTVVIAALSLIIGWPGPARAAVESGKAPVVLFLPIATESGAIDMENRITSELALTLDAFVVRRVDEGMDSFKDASLPQRLELLKNIAGVDQAVATVWVEQTPGILLLNLVALSTGQALVRIVEVRQEPGTPAALALTVQELLGQAYLFQQVPLPEQLRQTVREVSQTADEARQKRGEPDEKTAEKLSKWALLISAGARGGMVSFDAPSVKFAAGLAVIRSFQNGIFISPEARFLLGPEEQTGDLFLSSIGAGAALGVGYQWAFGRFSLAPQVNAAFVWQKTDVGVRAGGIESTHWFNAAFDFQIGLRWKLSDSLFLAILPGVTVNAVQKIFHQTSDNAVVWRSPRMEWLAMGGIGIHF